jgi:hypothetical protein
MSMLVRAENAYLNVLRVALLGVATIALLVAILGAVFGGWMFAKTLDQNRPHVPPVGAATLGDYVSEQKAALATTPAAPAATNASEDQTADVPEAIKPALKNLIAYDQMHKLWDPVVTNMIGAGLTQTYTGFAEPYRAAYAKSLVSLTHQLVISKGQPLSADQFRSLLRWHQAKFEAGIAAEQTSAAARASLSLQLITVAAAAFIAFLLLVFCFIFVKIERNLRYIGATSPIAGVRP